MAGLVAAINANATVGGGHGLMAPEGAAVSCCAVFAWMAATSAAMTVGA